jgi:hypothetical protein
MNLLDQLFLIANWTGLFYNKKGWYDGYLAWYRAGAASLGISKKGAQ